MNVREIDTLQLCRSWLNDPCDLIWDELLRRTRGELIAAPKGLVYEIALVDGFKLVRLIRPRNPADIDRQFLDLAFQPSEELDAATF